MTDLLSHGFIVNALWACVLIGLLLAYLGVHVVARGIVFVDLALGQISMLGVAFAEYFESDPTVVGIVFTVVGAFLLSFLQVHDRRLKQEALIGIVYAVAAAVTVLLISKAPHGDADISEVMFGSFFTVTSERILVIGVVFLTIGIVHALFRKHFFSLTEKFEANRIDQIRMFDPWNSMFYLSLGLAIVLAVRVGGVIPVFAYIVVPPVAAILVTSGKRSVVLIALFISVIGGVSGIAVSVSFDFPAGPAVVAALGGILLLGGVVRLVSGRGREKAV